MSIEIYSFNTIQFWSRSYLDANFSKLFQSVLKNTVWDDKTSYTKQFKHTVGTLCIQNLVKIISA